VEGERMPETELAITLHLVDPADGRSLQSWSFRQDRVTIGRDTTADLPLVDPYVSRVHVELLHSTEGWSLHCLGRNGVYVDGKSVDRFRLSPGMTFRLANVGPMFRFDPQTEPVGTSTLCFDSSSMVVLELNPSDVRQRVDEIAVTDYFQQLQQKARQLRSDRTAT
jgi:pSer/pThr/pTyr-binding forkhead associated (FHA) protein